MTVEPFVKTLEKIAPLSDGIKLAFQNAFKEVTYKRGTFLLKEGECCTHAYFIVKGVARIYYVIKEKEVTNRFIMANDVAISYVSFYSHNKSVEYIDLLEDSNMLVITKNDLNEIYLCYPELHKIMQLMLEQSQIESEKRSIIIRKLTAKEKYDIFSERYPVIFQKASVEQIATFLGIARETLSRIRSASLLGAKIKR